MGSRFRTSHDFGFVSLDISAVTTDDSGIYMCKAFNLAGEAVSSTGMKVKGKSSIVGDPLSPESWQQIQMKEAAMNRVPQVFVDQTPQQAPVFTTHLQSYDKLVEGQHIQLEAQVEPRADPNLRIEWLKVIHTIYLKKTCAEQATFLLFCSDSMLSLSYKFRTNKLNR